MYEYIDGKITEVSPSYVVVDCHGIGYLIEISLATFVEIKDLERIKIFTHYIIREDAHILYGFSTVKERQLFRLLISVSGVGPSIARVMLSSLSAQELSQAISSGEIALLQSIKGIGLKTAQRIILELKDKVFKEEGALPITLIKEDTKRTESLSALVMLGFVKAQSEKVVDRILKQTPDISIEELIKQALKAL